jgi:hypothetical protein
MHFFLSLSLFFSSWPGPSSFFSFSFSSTWPSPAGLSPFLSLPTARPSWPSQLSSFPYLANPSDAPSFDPFFLSLTDGACLSGSSPSLSLSHARTHAESGRGTASPAARRPEPACQGPRGHPVKPPPHAVGSAKPAAASSCFANPSPRHRLRHRTSVTITITASLLLCCRKPPELRLGVRNLAGLFSPSSPLSRTRDCLPSPPCRALPPCIPLRPPSRQLEPLNMFPSSLSFSQAKPESKPCPKSRLCDFPTSRRRPPPQTLASGASAGARAASTPRSRPIQIQRSRLDLDRGQITRYRSTLGYFAL